MKSSVLLQSLAAVCIATTVYTASAQSIQLFSPVNVRVSTQGTSYSSPNTFNTTILNLSCPSSPQAAISSSADGTGNVLVDNYISLQVGEAEAVNICNGNCFTSWYQTQASLGNLTNQDPDNFVSNGGVAPIDISSYFSPGPVQAQIGLTDQGGYLASSTLYLVTNCSSAGVAGPGLVTGNPISASNPTSAAIGAKLFIQFHHQPAGPVHLRSNGRTERRNSFDYRSVHALHGRHSSESGSVSRLCERDLVCYRKLPDSHRRTIQRLSCLQALHPYLSDW